MMSRDSVTVLSLNDDLLARVIGHLVRIEGVLDTVRTICLLSKRFAHLVWQPVTAWEKVRVWRTLSGPGGLTDAGFSQWARWLASVGPAVRKVSLYRPCADMSFLASLTALKVLKLQDVDNLPTRVPYLASLTALTALKCQCWLEDCAAPLDSLSSLSQLCQLHLECSSLSPGQELPASLSALSRLNRLSLRVQPRFNHHTLIREERPRIPWAWCQTAVSVSYLSLHAVDLPRLSGSGNPPIFPALEELCLAHPGPHLSATAMSHCRSVKDLELVLPELTWTEWDALVPLNNLERLHIVKGGGLAAGEPLPDLPALRALTALTYLFSHFYYPLIAQLPALRELHLQSADDREAPGWALPPGPWLRNLEHLYIEQGLVGSIEAVLRHATRLTSLQLEGCPWLRFSREELPLLMGLPLRDFKLDKQLRYSEYALPSPLWDEESLWVVDGLRAGLELRAPHGESVSCEIDV